MEDDALQYGEPQAAFTLPVQPAQAPPGKTRKVSPRLVRVVIGAVVVGGIYIATHHSSTSALTNWMDKYHNPDVTKMKADVAALSGSAFKAHPQVALRGLQTLDSDFTNWLENQPPAPNATIRNSWSLTLAEGGTAASDWIKAVQSTSASQANIYLARGDASIHRLAALQAQLNREATNLGYTVTK